MIACDTDTINAPRVRRLNPTLRLPGLFEPRIVDLFAGAGGASLGLERAFNRIGGPMAGRFVDVAINHDAVAIACHMANHPCTKHLRTDVRDVDPDTVEPGRDLLWLHASPDCTDFSNAKRGVPKRQSIRSLAWVQINDLGGNKCSFAMSADTIDKLIKALHKAKNDLAPDRGSER